MLSPAQPGHCWGKGGGGGGGGGGRDYLHCTKFIAGKCAESSGLVDMAAVDLQIACTILHMCGGFCRMVHIARVTPPSDALRMLDDEIRQCFALCAAIEVTNDVQCQTQLDLIKNTVI